MEEGREIFNREILRFVVRKRNLEICSSNCLENFLIMMAFSGIYYH